MDDENLLSGVILGWVLALLLVIFLAGCSRSTPVSDINNDIQQGATELVDYAQHNMEIDADKKLLIEGVKACAAKANALEKTCSESIRAYKAKADSWKLSAVFAGIIALFFGVLWLKGSVKGFGRIGL